MEPALTRARRANLVLAGYLLVTLPAAAMAALRDGPAAVAAAVGHLALLALASQSVAPRPGDRPWLRELRAWLPLLAIPALYAELPLLIAAVGTPFQDPRVLGWETATFGAPARTLASRWHSAVLSESLHLGYLSYYPLIYAPALLLRLRRRWRDLDATVLAVTIAFVVCFATFVVFPVQGPRYLWPAPERIAGGPIRELTLWLLGAGSSRGAAFPSSHAAVAFAHLVTSLWLQPRVAPVVALSCLGIAVGAVYGGFHYAIDMTAGIAVGCLAGLVALSVERPGGR